MISENPGDAMRKWRERIAVKQASLAREMGLSPSVLSDYESGRRASPGVGFIKRYVEALVKLDDNHHKLLSREVEPKGQISNPLYRRVQGANQGKEICGTSRWFDSDGFRKARHSKFMVIRF